MDAFPLLGDDTANNNDENDYPRGHSYSCSTRETSCNFFPGHDEVFGQLHAPVICDPILQQQQGFSFESPSQSVGASLNIEEGKVVLVAQPVSPSNHIVAVQVEEAQPPYQNFSAIGQEMLDFCGNIDGKSINNSDSHEEIVGSNVYNSTSPLHTLHVILDKVYHVIE